MCFVFICTDASKFGVSTVHVFICRHVMLPKDIAKLVPKNRLMTEMEWRSIGIQQSQGWIHYMVHGPGTTQYIGWCCTCCCLLRTSHHPVQKTINKVFIIHFSMRTNSHCFSVYYINLKFCDFEFCVCISVNVQL